MLQKIFTKASDLHLFQDYFESFDFKNYLESKLLVKNGNTEKGIWNISHYAYDEKLFLNRSKNELDSLLYYEFNNICFSSVKLTNDIFNYIKPEFSGIKRLLDEFEFPIFPLSSAIPTFLIRSLLFKIKKLLDIHKIKKDFRKHKNIKDMFIKPHETMNFNDSSVWNISKLVEKMKKDYSFLYKYLFFSGRNFYSYQDQPFDNFYQKKYLSLNIWEWISDKIQIFLSNLYTVGPFSDAGEFSKFESSILKNPEKCLSYMSLLTKKSEQEYEFELKKYFDSPEGLYPKLPFELNFLNLECLSNFSLSMQEQKDEKKENKKVKKDKKD